MRSFTRLSFNIRLSILLALVVSLLPPTGTARAASFTVNSLADNTTDDAFCTLREAILAANNAPANANCGAGSPADDTITFSVSGMITLGSTLPAIVSASIAGTLTIDGTGQNITISGNNAVQVMIVNSGADLTLQNLTIANGNTSGNGGGVYNTGGTVTITNSTFSGNNAGFGGGVFNAGGTLTVTNSTFSGNNAGFGGGGVYNAGGTLTVTNSTFSGNSASLGSGGGGIANNGTLTVTGSTFSGNSAGFGGGISNNGTLTVTNSTFSGNSANNSGGGISNASAGSTLTVTNSTFSGNSANTAGSGEGLHVFAGAVTIRNTIIANSVNGRDCVTAVTLSGTNNNNLIEDSSSACGLTHGSSGNIIGFDPMLGALTGSPAYFPLNPGSPAIDAGDNATCADPPVNNQSQNGLTRPQNGDGIAGAVCDIGSVENVQPFAPPTVSSIAATGAGTLLQGQTLATGPAQFTVTFNQDVTTASAENTANYLLVRAGGNGVQTLDCAGGVSGGDTAISIDSAVYAPATYTVTLNVNGGQPLPAGLYRLFVCGTTSIVNANGEELYAGLTDYGLVFLVSAQTAGGGGSGSGSSGTAGSALQLPSTGFPFGRVTLLPHQPQEKAYSATNLMLEIPTLKVKAPIVGVLKTEGGWDVTWLGNSVGWLEGSAYPTWKGNTVLTGHVWNADGTEGVFANLKDLKYGDRFTIRAYGQTYVYEVRENVRLWGANRVDQVFKPEELDWVTLLTCEGYNALTGNYNFRRIVRAVLVEIK